MGRIDQPSQEPIALVDATEAQEEVQQLLFLLAHDPVPTLLEPLVEKVDALPAADYSDPQFSPAQLVPLV